jgi:3'(2'), 5'-bisphosphate nucleotidase
MEKELETAKELAFRAGNVLLEHYAGKPDVQWKGQNDPVTAADRAVSELLVGELKRLFPEDGILSEEAPPNRSHLSRSRVWIIDPMDGTREFIDHLGEFAVMIGLAIDGKAFLGVVHQPASEKMYYAMAGKGAFLKTGGVTIPLRVASESDPARMTIALSRSHHSSQVDFIRERLGIKGEIRSGSIGLKIGMICEGRAHLYLHPGKRTYQWDSCAPEAILREAGGRMTSAYGDPLHYGSPELRNLHGIIASNGAMHERIVEVTRSVMVGFI